jgi:16S rRNA (guanine966-N2)-methyltransferase
VREGIASALASRDAFAEAIVLDLFAGTGAFAFEALSRGAQRAVLIDRNSRACKQITKSATTLGVAEQCNVVTSDLLRDAVGWIKRVPDATKFTLIFVDPPYVEVSKIPALLSEIVNAGVVAEGALFVLERASRDPVPAADFLAPLATYRYGDTAVDLFVLSGAKPS